MRIVVIFFTAWMCVLQVSCAQTKAVVSETNNGNPKVGNENLKFEQFIAGNFSTVDADVYGNLFVTTSTNQFKKISVSGDSVSVFNDVKKYGNPSLIDINNPLKILLYYKNFATVVFLDRLLTLRGSLNFRSSNIFAAKAVATSYDNHLWLFDEQDFTLKKIDESGRVLLASNDIRNQIGATPSATSIMDRENVVYVYDIDKGFFLFDYYGAYRKTIPVTGWDFVNVSGNLLYGFKDGKLITYQMDTNMEKQFLLPSAFARNRALKAVNGKLYLLKEEGVYVFEIK